MSLPLPKISVVTPSLDQGRFLERTIRSVFEQDYPTIEYIIMDGGSTDRSVEIIRRFAKHLAYWASGPDGGQSAAINSGWRRASGDVLAWLNSDDYYLPGTLRWAGEYFARNPRVWVAYGQGIAVDSSGAALKILGRPYNRRAMVLSGNCIPQPAAFIRREAIEAVGLLDESLNYLMDMDLFLRIGSIRPPVFVVRPAAAMTTHQAAKTIRARKAMAMERALVRLRYARTYEKPLVGLVAGASRLMHTSPKVTAAIDRVRSELRR